MKEPVVLLFGIIKTAIVIAVFLSGCVSIVFTQVVGLFIGKITGSRDFVQGWMSRTKDSFIVLLTGVISFASHSSINIRVSSSDLTRERLYFVDGMLKLKVPAHTLAFANHQIYTDWVFLWWLAQCADLGGFVYIILKAELSKLPLLGFGMKCYEFIFLTRKWDHDKFTMGRQLRMIDANARGYGPANGIDCDSHGNWPQGVDSEKGWPYQLIIYPEGTNLSANTRDKTEKYAAKAGKTPFRHVLLPRTTGLRFSLLQLKDTLQEVYDITVGYSGVRPEEYGQDIYTLYQAFLRGNNPKLVDIHVRVLKLDEIPLGKLHYDDPEEEARDIELFEKWLYRVWEEKDNLMETFYNTGSFMSESAHEATVITSLKVSKLKFIQIFYWPLISFMFIRCLYIVLRWLL